MSRMRTWPNKKRWFVTKTKTSKNQILDCLSYPLTLWPFLILVGLGIKHLIYILMFFISTPKNIFEYFTKNPVQSFVLTLQTTDPFEVSSWKSGLVFCQTYLGLRT